MAAKLDSLLERIHEFQRVLDEAWKTWQELSPEEKRAEREAAGKREREQERRRHLGKRLEFGPFPSPAVATHVSKVKAPEEPAEEPKTPSEKKGTRLFQLLFPEKVTGTGSEVGGSRAQSLLRRLSAFAGYIPGEERGGPISRTGPERGGPSISTVHAGLRGKEKRPRGAPRSEKKGPGGLKKHQARIDGLRTEQEKLLATQKMLEGRKAHEAGERLKFVHGIFHKPGDNLQDIVQGLIGGRARSTAVPTAWRSHPARGPESVEHVERRGIPVVRHGKLDHEEVAHRLGIDVSDVKKLAAGEPVDIDPNDLPWWKHKELHDRHHVVQQRLKANRSELRQARAISIRGALPTEPGKVRTRTEFLLKKLAAARGDAPEPSQASGAKPEAISGRQLGKEAKPGVTGGHGAGVGARAERTGAGKTGGEAGMQRGGHRRPYRPPEETHEDQMSYIPRTLIAAGLISEDVLMERRGKHARRRAAQGKPPRQHVLDRPKGGGQPGEGERRHYERFREKRAAGELRGHTVRAEAGKRKYTNPTTFKKCKPGAMIATRHLRQEIPLNQFVNPDDDYPTWPIRPQCRASLAALGRALQYAHPGESVISQVLRKVNRLGGIRGKVRLRLWGTGVGGQRMETHRGGSGVAKRHKGYGTSTGETDTRIHSASHEIGSPGHREVPRAHGHAAKPEVEKMSKRGKKKRAGKRKATITRGKTTIGREHQIPRGIKEPPQRAATGREASAAEAARAREAGSALAQRYLARGQAGKKQKKTHKKSKSQKRRERQARQAVAAASPQAPPPPPPAPPPSGRGATEKSGRKPIRGTTGVSGRKKPTVTMKGRRVRGTTGEPGRIKPGGRKALSSRTERAISELAKELKPRRGHMGASGRRHPRA